MTELNHHLRNNDGMCKISRKPAEILERFNDEQEKALNTLTVRRGVIKTDAERWKDAWKIMFPKDVESDIPDPCES